MGEIPGTNVVDEILGFGFWGLVMRGSQPALA
jgi:hypothetical protein